MSDDELSSSLPENSLEAAYSLTPPDPNELIFAVRISQSHPASEQHIELIHPNVSLDELSFTIQVMAFAPLRPIESVFVKSVHSFSFYFDYLSQTDGC